MGSATLMYPTRHAVSQGEACGNVLAEFRQIVQDVKDGDPTAPGKASELQEKIRQEFPAWVYEQTVRIVARLD